MPERRWPAHRSGPCAVVAHRGASAVEPENTVAAFAAAARLGADAVELDVRRCASGELVVHHDPALADGRALCELAVSDLPSWLPSLAEALEVCGDLSVDVEIKNLPFEPGFDPGESTAVEVAGWVMSEGLGERVLVTAFTPSTLEAVRATRSEVLTGLLVLAVSGADETVAAAVAVGCSALNPHHAAVDEALVEAAHRSGLEVIPWTVDDPERVSALGLLGVDGVITNVPDIARRALEA